MANQEDQEYGEYIIWLQANYGADVQAFVGSLFEQGKDWKDSFYYEQYLASLAPTSGFPPGVAGGDVVTLPTTQEPLPTGFENAEVIVPGTLLQAPDGSYYDYKGFPVNDVTATTIIAEYNKALEETAVEPEGISEYETELIRQRELDREQRRREENMRLLQEANEQQRLAGEFGAGQELQREQLMAGEAQDIRSFMLQRQQILAQLKAHPRNWLEALEFQTPGILPEPSRAGINPEGGF